MTDLPVHPSYYPQISGDLLSRTNLFRWMREFVRNSGIQPGYYLEFGVQNGESMIDAYRQLRGVVTHMYGFDSFQGLPPISGEDEKQAQVMPIYHEGNFNSLSKSEVEQLIALNCRIPSDQLMLVEGFFEHVLPEFDRREFADKGPLIGVYLDTNLYSSTKEVLSFIEDLIDEGTWLLFDDYWCNRGSPNFGQQKAIREWLQSQSRIGLSEYCNFRGFGRAYIAYVK